MAEGGRSVGKEVTISLIVTATLIGILLVAIATVLIYYRRQTRRMAQPRKDGRPTGYRTGLNADKMKKQAAATLKGSDVMKEPVNWSNASPAEATKRRSRSVDSAVIDIGDLVEAAAPVPPPPILASAVAIPMTPSCQQQHQQQHQHHRSRPQQRQQRRRNSWSCLCEARREMSE